MIPLCQEMGVAVIPWSPLAGGRLVRGQNQSTPRTEANRSGAVAKNYEQSDNQVIQALTRVAEDHRVSPAEVSIAWLLRKPGITSPIIGTTKPKHLTEAIAALDLQLTDKDVSALEQYYATRPVMGMYFPVSDELKLSVK